MDRKLGGASREKVGGVQNIPNQKTTRSTTDTRVITAPSQTGYNQRHICAIDPPKGGIRAERELAISVSTRIVAQHSDLEKKCKASTEQ